MSTIGSASSALAVVRQRCMPMKLIDCVWQPAMKLLDFPDVADAQAPEPFAFVSLLAENERFLTWQSVFGEDARKRAISSESQRIPV